MYSYTVEESVKDMDFLAGMERSQEKLAQKAFMVHSARNALSEHTKMLLDLLNLYAFHALQKNSLAALCT